MKKFIVLSLFFLSFVLLNAQQNPVSWAATYKSISATEGEVIITGTIEKGWHTYSQRPTEAGPIPTSFTFTPSKSFEVVGKTIETDAHEEYVPAFEAKIFVFTGKAEFRQKIKLKSKAGFPVSFKVEYMCCNDNMCLPPKIAELTVKTQ